MRRGQRRRKRDRDHEQLAVRPHLAASSPAPNIGLRLTNIKPEVVVCKFPGSDDSKRARRLREAMGFNGRGTQQAFANFLGVDRGRWNNVECGAPLSKEMALRIVRKFPGVTLDWLFLGRTDGLTAEMALALSEPSKGNDAGGDSPSRLSPVTVQTVGLG